MIKSTTPTIEGKRITQYHGVVTDEAILGANIFKDFFAGIRDIIGGRSGAIDYESVSMGNSGGMLMVSVSGTAVKVE
jgi:uncharacterized protein YbjQ (UPF0145 family)